MNYESMIGKRVWKQKPTAIKEPKPFKSGLKINTVTGIVDHPILHIPAFTFEEDDSVVECRRCYVVPPETKFYQYWQQGSEDAEWVCLNELNAAQVEEYFAEKNIIKWRRVPNPPLKWFRREMNTIREIIEKLESRLELYGDVVARIENENSV